MGGDGYDTPLLVQVAGAGAENAFFTTHSLMDASLGKDAVKKFIMDYQAPIEAAGRSAKAAYPDFRIVFPDAWWKMVSQLLPPDFFEAWKGLGHGGEGETSICLELLPELCGMSKAAGVVPHLPKYVDVKRKFNELTNTGVTGDPTKATPEKGRKMREAMVEAVVKSISALDATDWDYLSPEVVKVR